MNFSFLNCKTVYKYKDSTGVEHSRDSACFERFFYDNSAQSPVEFSIQMCITTKDIDDNYNNFCFFSKDEICLWLDELKLWNNFDYDIIKDYCSDPNYICINLVTRDWHYAQKVLLTLIRYLYESPFNFILKEAIALHKYGYYPELTIFNKFILASKCITDTFNNAHVMLQPDRVYKFLDFDTLSSLKIQSNNHSVSLFIKNFSKYADAVSNARFKYEDFHKVFISNDEKKLLFDKEDVDLRISKFHQYNYEIFKKYNELNG